MFIILVKPPDPLVVGGPLLEVKGALLVVAP